MMNDLNMVHMGGYHYAKFTTYQQIDYLGTHLYKAVDS